MKPFGIAAAFALAAAAPAVHAGEICGTVPEGGKPVLAGTAIEVKCPGGT